jgi:tetratricopeptide (TPR) repeat protein
MKTTLTFFVLAAILGIAGCQPAAIKSAAKTKSERTSARATEQTLGQIAKYEGLVAKFPNDAEMRIRLGQAFIQKGRETGDLEAYASGDKEFEHATRLDPKNPTAWQHRALAMTIFHKFERAIEFADKAIGLNPSDFRAYGALSDAYLELGDYDKSVDAAQRMIDLRPDLASYSRAAKLRQVFGDNKGAELLYLQAINSGSPHAENTAWCRVMLGDLNLKSGAYAAAKQQFEFALKTVPGYRHAEMGLGRTLWALGQGKEAGPHMEKACQGVAPIAYLSDLGDLYAELGDAKLAEATFSRIDETVAAYRGHGIEGDDLQVAMFLLDHGRDLDRALKLAEHEISHHNTIEAHMTLAWALHKSGRHDEAAKRLEGALRTNVQDSLVWFRAAKIYDAAGEKAKSQKLMIAARSLNPRFSIVYAKEAEAALARQ